MGVSPDLVAIAVGELAKLARLGFKHFAKRETAVSLAERLAAVPPDARKVAITKAGKVVYKLAKRG